MLSPHTTPRQLAHTSALGLPRAWEPGQGQQQGLHSVFGIHFLSLH